MEISNDKRVQQFLDDNKEIDAQKYDIVQACRKIVFSIFPDVNERMMYGGIMFSLDDDFGGVFISKKHVSFEFSHGYLFEDPKKTLEGSGKFRRHLKLKSIEDVFAKQAEFFVKQVK